MREDHPGPTDHHIHIRALAAHLDSISLNPADVADRQVMSTLLCDQPGEGWLRCVDYHESTLGELDRDALDCTARPVRVQHRSGKVWVMNSAAIAALDLENVHEEGVERDAQGQVTGRIFRMDAWLNRALQQAGVAASAQDLSPVRDHLLCLGLTSVCDATYTNTAEDESALVSELAPLRVHCMGSNVSGICIGFNRRSG